MVIDEAYYHYVEKSSEYASFIERAADRGRRYGSENTLEQAKADIRRKHGAEGPQNPGG